MLEKKMLDDLIANVRFWYSKKTIKVNVHYEFMLDMSNTQAMTIRILKKFPGVIAEYSNIHMSSDTQMSYDFNVIANPNLCNVESKRFKNFTSDIFRNIIYSSVEHAKEQNENRNTDLVKSDAQRTVHEESVAVSEERVPERKPRKKAVRRNQKVHPTVQ
jgi:hypothetical protein